MKVRLVDYDTWKDECDVLMQMHFLEVLAPRGYTFGMNDELFEQLGDNLRIIVAYDDNRAPIGYCKTIISTDLYDQTTPVCQTPAFYLHPDHRKGLLGVTLLKAAQADVAALVPGARWRLGVPIDGPKDLGRVMERFLGMAPIERLYQKNLPGGE